MLFNDLLAFLPKPEYPSSANPVSGVVLRPSTMQSFVEPELTVEEGDPTTSKVLVVAAPGAVGKTTLAHEIAARQQALYWDLAQQGVSANAFVGMITNSFGFAETPHLHEMIGGGRSLFILDALDEAVIRAGFDNFVDFLGDIARALAHAPDRPQVVLLGRTESAALAKLALEEEAIPHATIAIDFFDRARASDFIDVRLDLLTQKAGRATLHRRNRVPFEAARDQLFANAARALGQSPETVWEDESSRRFLGYAPVLQAFADYLEVPNYATILNELQSSESQDRAGRWTFLSGIVRHLIQREKEKVQNAVRPALEKQASGDWSQWNELYSHDEQLARIAASKTGAEIPSALVPAMPGGLYQAYEQRIQDQVGQHPFFGDGQDGFASVVFRDYLVAWALTSAPDFVEAVRTYAITSQTPSPILARFAFEMAGDEPLRCDGDDIGILFDSLISASTTPEEVSLSIDPLGTGGEMVEFHIGPSEILYALLREGSTISFYRSLSSASISTERIVRFGQHSPTFLLGPYAFVEAEQFEFSCDSLTIKSPAGLVADEAPRANPQHISIVPSASVPSAENGPSFTVSWPRLAFPWNRYKLIVQPGGDFAAHPRWNTLRKLLLMFRRQRTRKVETVINARWSESEIADGSRDKLLRLAEEHGVLTVEDIYYVFSPEFSDLRELVGQSEGRLSPRSLAFVRDFLA